MSLVEFTYFPAYHFPGEDERRSRIFVNPDHVVLVVMAAPDQCWLRLVNSAQEYLVQGDIDQVAKRLYDPGKSQGGT